MIYSVGITSEKYKSISVEDCLAEFEKEETIQFDLETTSLDPHTGKIKCFQLGNYFDQYVIHPKYLKDFKKILESKELLGQNLKFDLRWLYKNDIWPTKIWDTYLAEGVLFCGLKLHKRSLAAIAKRCLQIDLDKSVRESIWEKEELNDREIEYSANDVKHLFLIKAQQEIELKQKDLEKALEIENQFVLCLAYIEYCGFKLDINKWKTKIAKDNQAFTEALQKLNDYVIKNNHTEFIEKQLDLFSTDVKLNISWSSPKQVIPLFKKLGINTTIVEGGIKKDTIEATHLSNQLDKFEILPLYIDYKEKEKVISTYGESFLGHINKNTGRIHTQFTQIMSTGRISSGGNGNINFQNIPSDKETRACFVSEEDNTLIISDYSSQESILLANQSLDSELLKFYDSGEGDMHAFVAKQVFPELADVSLLEIKEKHKEKRTIAKTANFSLVYGATGTTIAANSGISLEEGNKFYETYFKVFPGIKEHFEKQKKRSLEEGHILMSPLTNRKSYIHNYEEYKTLKEEINSNFWEQYKALKKKAIEGYTTDQYLSMKDKVFTYFKIKGDIERKSNNYFIQASAGEITKLACIKIFEFIQKNGLHNTIKFVNVIHDEVVVECPTEMTENIKHIVEQSMEEAGKPYCARVPLKADAMTSPYWRK